MRLFLIRHADPDLTKDALTNEGHKEAEALAVRLAKIGIDEIYSSPLNRSIQTAKPLAQLTGKQIVIQDWAREHDWIIDKRSAWNVPGEVIRGQQARLLDQHMQREFEDLKKNSDQFFKNRGYERIEGRYRPLQSNNKKIALFAHGGLGLSLLSHLLEIPLELTWSGFFLDPASITTIHFEQRSDNWAVPRCLCLGDVSHLNEMGPSSIYKKFS